VLSPSAIVNRPSERPSDRVLDVAVLLANGFTLTQAAECFYVHEATLRSAMRNARFQLDARTNTQLVLRLIDQGWLFIDRSRQPPVVERTT
jgi:DNA-binding NarL/FixJ family response regulator